VDSRLKESNNDILHRGKTIRNLIKELLSFEDLDLEVKMSLDSGDTLKSISIIGNIEGKCALINFDE
jgi:hypothetical protein